MRTSPISPMRMLCLRPRVLPRLVWPLDLVVAFPARAGGGVLAWLGCRVLNTWIATTFWSVPVDPAVPVYAIGGLGGLVLAVQYLRYVQAPGAFMSIRA